MIATFRHLAAAMLAMILAVAAVPAQAQTDVTNAPDPYVHSAAGVRFPAAAGVFRRGRVVHYDAKGYDASVGYQIDGMAGEMTLYVYPDDGETCRSWFDGADNAVMKRGTSVRDEGAAPLKLFPGVGVEQYSARYTIPASSLDYDNAEIASVLWVGCRKDARGDGWVIKYRGSFLAADAAKSEAMVKQLFALIDWSPLLGG